ncbi:MAG TPA: tyrosine--tRNA ligase [Caldisericia bacterium]|nr:tyrosine--tRNA ligase [Caldisericia bacterium]HPO28769.1 tyrosine--tRNA ligase [Caldisericia bacterium]
MEKQEILDKIKKNTVDFVSEEELLKKLSSKKSLKIKLGADPTAPDLHLGHAVVLEKLKDFQDLGHEIIFVIGDFTALIGDPSGRSKVRKALSKEEIEQNAKTYVSQVSKILDVSKIQIRYNSEWLSKIDLSELIKIMSNFTIARIIERDDFSKRYKQNTPIYMHEFLYPLLQAYDSVAIEADVELGGTDQKFNLLLGREMQTLFSQEEQVIITLPLLVGTDGSLKMSKSYGNYIGITEDPITMYGKVMSIPDNLILDYFKLVLCYDENKLSVISESLKIENPMKLKMKLAKEIVTKYHSEKDSQKAEEMFTKIHREHSLPTELEEYIYKGPLQVKAYELINVLNLSPSKSEAKRMILQGGLEVNGEKITDPFFTLNVKNDMIIKLGKRKFVKIRIQNP